MKIKEYEQNLIQYIAKRLEIVDRRKGYPKRYLVSCLVGQEHELLKITFNLNIAVKDSGHARFYRGDKIIHIRNFKKRK